MTEPEITRLISLTSAIARHHGLPIADDPELSELQQDVRPEQVLERIHQQNQAAG